MDANVDAQKLSHAAGFTLQRAGKSTVKDRVGRNRSIICNRVAKVL